MAVGEDEIRPRRCRRCRSNGPIACGDGSLQANRVRFAQYSQTTHTREDNDDGDHPQDNVGEYRGAGRLPI